MDLVEFYLTCEHTLVIECVNNRCPVLFICENRRYFELPIYYAEGEI